MAKVSSTFKPKFVEQAMELFQRLKLWQKALFIGVPSFFILGFIALLMFSNVNSRPEYKTLFSDLESNDAKQIIDYLDKNNIDYKLEENGTIILIPEDAVYSTRLDLTAKGLPENSTVGYELFDKTNLGMSEFVQQINYRRALEGELARTISALQEVKKSRVHIVIPKTELFEKDQKEPSASVTLFLDKKTKLRLKHIEGIQTLVASSIEGMLPEKVSIVDQTGKLLSEVPIDENSIAGLTALQLDQQRRHEKQLEEKVQSMLDGVIGPGNSKVTVTANLDFTKINKTMTEYNPEEQVARSEQNILEVSSTADSLSYPNFSQDRNDQNQIANYEISNTISQIQAEIGDIESLSVAVMINQKETMITGEDGLRRMDYIARPDSMIKQIEDIVVKAVGLNTKRGDQISVIQLPFETLLNYDVEDLNPKPWYQQTYYIRLIAVALIMLVVILIMITILYSKYNKNRIRIAMGIPENVKLLRDEIVEEIEEEEEEEEDSFENLVLEDDLMLLQEDVPEALVLESEITSMFDNDSSFSDELQLQQASYETEVFEEEMSETQIMNVELKKTVEEFCDNQPSDAVKLIRVFMEEDIDKNPANFFNN